MEIKILKQDDPSSNKLWQESYSTWAVNLAHRHYLANQRQGTSKVKSRGEVKASTRKIWKQKHTGRARHGALTAPQFRGGGIAFGPSNEKNYSFKVNKKVKKKALQSILSKKIEEQKVKVIKEIPLANYKTKEAKNFLFQFGLGEKKLLIIFSTEENKNNELIRSFRNLPQVSTTSGQLVNTYQVLIAPEVLFTDNAFNEVEKRLMN